MSTRDPRVDAYIEKAAPFARPILIELRERMHAACPDLVETIKWRMPTFEHGGILAGMAAFNKHCSFGFWQDQQLRELPGLAEVLEAAGRTTTVDDLPSRSAFTKAVRQAVALRAATAEAPKPKAKPKPAKPPIAMHPEFARALAVRRVPAGRPARVPRVDRRRQAGRDPRAAHRSGGRVDRRRQAAQLEVRELLSQNDVVGRRAVDRPEAAAAGPDQPRRRGSHHTNSAEPSAQPTPIHNAGANDPCRSGSASAGFNGSCTKRASA
jgi:hypothetical protein